MRVFNGFDELTRFTRPVVTVGSYDGVHAGHRKLITDIVEMARRDGGESVVVTFWPHPRTVLGNMGEPVELLSTPGEKATLLAGLGVDNLIIAPFTKAFSCVAPDVFVRDYLVGRIGVSRLVVGFNHHFGRNHEGGFGDLKKLGAGYGFTVTQVPEQDVHEHKVSSTVIRRLIRQGEMREAARFLGAPYIIMWPPGEGKLMPPPGNYPVKVHSGKGIPHAAVLTIRDGQSPSLDPPPAKDAENIVEFA
ncbi:MAG: FAD synthetase family protein [Rikenellaceae bacterium]|jgi:riboflavin kinase/FMN adenylyltransferase|nr:FAD synthetase family protein [Rikenellaceae bacterium]